MIKPVYHNLDPIFQPEDSNACGPTALYMIAKYFNAPVANYQTFIDSFGYEGYGTYMPQLGVKALELGLKAEITMFNPHLFSVRDIGSTNPTAAFEAAKTKHVNHKTWPNALEWFDKFNNMGGITHIDIPNIQHIANALANGALILALGTTNFLIGDTGLNCHFLVVCGIDDQFVYVTDSANYNQTNTLQPLTGRYKHTHAQFIYGIHAATHADIDNCAILVVSKK